MGPILLAVTTCGEVVAPVIGDDGEPGVIPEDVSDVPEAWQVEGCAPPPEMGPWREHPISIAHSSYGESSLGVGYYFDGGVETARRRTGLPEEDWPDAPSFPDDGGDVSHSPAYCVVSPLDPPLDPQQAMCSPAIVALGAHEAVPPGLLPVPNSSDRWVRAWLADQSGIMLAYVPEELTYEASVGRRVGLPFVRPAIVNDGRVAAVVAPSIERGVTGSDFQVSDYWVQVVVETIVDEEPISYARHGNSIVEVYGRIVDEITEDCPIDLRCFVLKTGDESFVGVALRTDDPLESANVIGGGSYAVGDCVHYVGPVLGGEVSSDSGSRVETYLDVDHPDWMREYAPL